jgi:putative Mg2+ transporter-C (MgtC) family protein
MALLCGLLLGLERESKDKPAGLRTLILIVVGSTVYMMVGNLFLLVTEGSASITRIDPSRIAGQVVSGIGFLGAGSIIQARGTIHGLTTAASIWVAAGIGLCIGLGFPLIGLGITLLVLLVLVILDPLGNWLHRRGEERSLELVIPNDMLVLRSLENVLRQHSGLKNELKLESRPDEDTLRVAINYVADQPSTPRLLKALSELEGVRGAPYDEGEIKTKR